MVCELYLTLKIILKKATRVDNSVKEFFLKRRERNRVVSWKCKWSQERVSFKDGGDSSKSSILIGQKLLRQRMGEDTA